MRFQMSTDEKAVEVPTYVIAQPEPPAPSEKKSKQTIICAVTGIVVVALILVAILVGIYIFTEAEKEIVKVSLEFKTGMKQDIEQNPNTNVVQLYIQQNNQESWIYNDYNSDMKVIKIKTATTTNCFVTPLNESAPTELPNMNSTNQNAETVTVIYENTGTPIKDTSFLSKTSRDACNGISTYWLYPTCDIPAKNAPPHNITDMQTGRQKRTTYYYSPIHCGGWHWVSTCNFHGSCSYDTSHTPATFTFTATWTPPASGCRMIKCTYCCWSVCWYV